MFFSLVDREDLPSPFTDDESPVAPLAGSTSINYYRHSKQSPISLPGTEGHHQHVGVYPTITEEEEGERELQNSLTVTLSLSEPSRGRGIQPSQRRKDDQRVLVFHGIILRSQLVTLLENKIFFNEGDGVSLAMSI